MSTHFKMLQRPANCVAAHSSNVFTFRPPQATCVVAIDAGGKVLIVLGGSFAIGTPQPGQRLYIAQGLYKGFHLVRQTVQGHILVLETAYVGAVYNAVPVYYIVQPTIELYKGWAPGEIVLPDGTELFDRQPRALLGSFKPEVNTQGLFSFDVQGYLKAAMPTPYAFTHNSDEADPTFTFLFLHFLMDGFTKVDVVCNGNKECTLQVFNAAITTAQLNQYFVDTDVPLRPLVRNLEFSYGLNWFDFIYSNYLIRLKA